MRGTQSFLLISLQHTVVDNDCANEIVTTSKRIQTATNDHKDVKELRVAVANDMSTTSNLILCHPTFLKLITESDR